MSSNTTVNEVNIKCGVCSNVMPAAKFLSHKERKHPTIEFVKYIKLPAIERELDPNVAYVKCRYCPNKIPEHSMDKHMQKCHVECHVCGTIVSKASFDKHMERKHCLGDLQQRTSAMSTDNLLGHKFNDGHRSMQRSSSVCSKPQPPNLRINEYQLKQFLREQRVYRKDGFLYLRSVDRWSSKMNHQQTKWGIMEIFNHNRSEQEFNMGGYHSDEAC